MSVPININGTIIQIPSSAASANWSPAIIQAFQAIAEALALSVGSADVPPQTFVLSSNINSNLVLPALSFSTTDVRGAIINYYVYRNTNSTTVTETGEMFISYNANGPVNGKWNMSREFTGGDQNNTGQGALCSFNITDTGQVRFSSTSISGTGYSGFITFSAKAILEQ